MKVKLPTYVHSRSCSALLPVIGLVALKGGGNVNASVSYVSDDLYPKKCMHQ